MTLLIRTMTEEDIRKADAIRAAAGWNQQHSDWKRLLTYEPDGCFVAEQDRRIVGTVTTTTFGQSLAWIGMMLVHEEFRRRGIGRRLMERALEFLSERSVHCIRLDATPYGQGLYEQLGFQPEWGFHRWSRPGVQPSGDPGAGDPVCDQTTKRTSARQPETHFERDASAFGSDRRNWLRLLAADSNCVTDRGGFAMLRSGSLADYIGPMVCDSSETAEALLSELLKTNRRQVFWDVPEPNTAATQLADRLQFRPTRPLLRMRLGSALSEPQLRYQFAIGDPATG